AIFPAVPVNSTGMRAVKSPFFIAVSVRRRRRSKSLGAISEALSTPMPVVMGRRPLLCERATSEARSRSRRLLGSVCNGGASAERYTPLLTTRSCYDACHLGDLLALSFYFPDRRGHHRVFRWPESALHVSRADGANPGAGSLR